FGRTRYGRTAARARDDGPAESRGTLILLRVAVPGLLLHARGSGGFPSRGRHADTMNQRGSILVGLLWCLVLLSVVVISVLHASRIDLLVARNHADTIQAHYLARAGIERAIALLYHDARDRSRSARHHTGNLHEAPEQFQEIPLGRGTWSVLRKALPHEAGHFVFGIQDEEGRFNVNTAPAEDFETFHQL